MKKVLISLGIILLAIIFLLAIKDDITLETMANDDRFIEIYKEHCYTVFYDKNTKVEYIKWTSFKYGTGITILLDPEGKPLLHIESEDRQ